MKMLSENHVVVIFQIDHPTFGRLIVDKFQRTRQSLESIFSENKIKWCDLEIPIESHSDILVDNSGVIAPTVYIVAPWDIDFYGKQDKRIA